MNILCSFPGPQLHDYFVKRVVPALLFHPSHTVLLGNQWTSQLLQTLSELRPHYPNTNADSQAQNHSQFSQFAKLLEMRAQVDMHQTCIFSSCDKIRRPFPSLSQPPQILPPVPFPCRWLP